MNKTEINTILSSLLMSKDESNAENKKTTLGTWHVGDLSGNRTGNGPLRSQFIVCETQRIWDNSTSRKSLHSDQRVFVQVGDDVWDVYSGTDLVSESNNPKIVVQNGQGLQKLLLEAKKELLGASVEINMDDKPLQRIFYGAPGTGKSFQTDKVVKDIPDTARVTFHPDSDYASFVGCYKPSMDSATPSQDSVNALSLDELAQILQDTYTAAGRKKGRGKKEEEEQTGKILSLFLFADKYLRLLIGANGKPNLNDLVKKAGVPEKACKRWLSAAVDFLKRRNAATTTSNHIIYKFVPQAFTKAYELAWRKMPMFLSAQNEEAKKAATQFLVIEEINRGNCAQIFGDLFQLLDRDDKTGYSSYPVDPDADLAKHLHDWFRGGYVNGDGTKSPNVFEGLDAAAKTRKAGTDETDATWDDVLSGRKLVLPPNLHIWATMNTSDQSLFPMDSAFKRRWEWKYVPITKHEKEDYKIEIDGSLYDWWEFVTAINDRIFQATESEDKKLGYFFVKAKKKDGRNVIDDDLFLNKVVFYLWNDVFKNSEPERAFRFKRPGEDKKSDNTFQDFFDRETGVRKDAMLKEFLAELDVSGTKIVTGGGAGGSTGGASGKASDGGADGSGDGEDAAADTADDAVSDGDSPDTPESVAENGSAEEG